MFGVWTKEFEGALALGISSPCNIDFSFRVRGLVC